MLVGDSGVQRVAEEEEGRGLRGWGRVGGARRGGARRGGAGGGQEGWELMGPWGKKGGAWWAWSDGVGPEGAGGLRVWVEKGRGLSKGRGPRGVVRKGRGLKVERG